MILIDIGRFRTGLYGLSDGWDDSSSVLFHRSNPCEDTDSALETDPRRQKCHLLSHPEMGRTDDSVSNRPVAQQSPPLEASYKLWWIAVLGWMCIRHCRGLFVGRLEGRESPQAGADVRHHHTRLVEAAQSAAKAKGTYLRDKFYRLKARRGYKRAVLAVAHKSLVAIYHMLSQKVSYQDLGDVYLDKLNKYHLTRNLVHRPEHLGYIVILEQKAAQPKEFQPGQLPAELCFHDRLSAGSLPRFDENRVGKI